MAIAREKDGTSAESGTRQESGFRTLLNVSRYILQNIPGAHWKLPVLAGLGVIGILTTISVPLINAKIINALIAGAGATLKWDLLLLGIAVLLQVTLTFAHQGGLLRIEENLAKVLRGQMFRRFVGLDLREAENFQIGDVQSRIVNDSGIIKSVLSTMLLQASYDLLTLLVLVTLLWRMNRILMAVTVVWAPLTYLLGQWLSPKVAAATKSIRESVAEVQSTLQAWISRLLPVQAFRLEAIAGIKFDESNQKLTTNSINASWLGLKGNIGSVLAASVPSFIISAYGGYLVLRGVLTVGELVAFLAYFSYFNGPTQRLAAVVITGLPSLQPVWERCRLLIAQGQNDAIVAGHQIRGLKRVIAEGVSFSFGQGRVFEIEIPSFCINSGEIIGITGPNGSGKSTFARLLSGLYKPHSGAFTVDVVDGEGGPEPGLRDVVSYLPQRNTILDGTLRENVTNFDPTPNVERLELISRQLDMDGILRAIEGGWDGRLDGGKLIRLSGGQIQRIALAAMLYRDLPILVLDEPTGGMDKDVLGLFKDLIQLEKGRKTIVLISHSQEILSCCDRIFCATAIPGTIGKYQLLCNDGTSTKQFCETIPTRKLETCAVSSRGSSDGLTQHPELPKAAREGFYGL